MVVTSVLLRLSLFVLACCGRVCGSYLLNDVASCSFGELPCDNGQCIRRKGWCDGPVDCHDASDEQYCRSFDSSDTNAPQNPNECNPSQHFRCDNGLCIPKAARCDDMPDCENGEEEENCDYAYESIGEVSTAEFPKTTTIMTSQTILDTTITKAGYSTTALPQKPTEKTLQSDGSLLRIPSQLDVLRKAVGHVIEERDVRWGWGKSTPRMVSALYLANESYFDLDNHDGLMTKKQLEVQLALDLMKHAEKPIRLHELAHYVHALIVTCHNPKNFHGVNIIRMLKKSMAARQSRGQFVHPIAYLALCNAEDLPDSSIKKLKNMGYRRSEEQRWLDVQALSLLAISCRTMWNSSTTSSSEWLHLRKDVARNISDWQQPDGSFGTIYSTGLVLQALIASEEPSIESNMGRALAYLLTKQDWQGNFGSDLDNYYVLPALNRKSFASIRLRNCRPNPYGTQSTEGGNKRSRLIYVHYSLWIGGEKNEIHTITLGVPRHSSFLEVMEAAGKVNPRYKHEVLTTARGTAVNALAGRASDIERSTYWTLYRRVPLPFRPQLANTTATIARLKLLGAKRWIKDLKKLHPKDGEHLAFWYKPYL